MLSYYSKWKKDTEGINPKVPKASNLKTMLLSKFAVYNS